jgi:hypothetical protein
MTQEPASPLGQAFAALIALIIAALAEHAAEHPVLAPGLRVTIRQLEKLAREFQALADRYENPQPKRRRRPALWPPRPHLHNLAPYARALPARTPAHVRRTPARAPPGKERVFFL